MSLPPSLAGAVGHLDQRLERGLSAPVVVAVSGGGDSLALLLIAKAWADNAGRRLLALTVDHRLQPQGPDWAAWCAARCARLGVEHRTLAWTGPKPASGLPAAARAARHALVAEAARESGAAVVLMAHTADDRLEAGLMRAAGATTPTPRIWSPSPAWPQGRGVFVLRPLLDVRRADLRAWLEFLGETWIEDPANGDLRYARSRARRDAPAGAVIPPVCGGTTRLDAALARLGERPAMLCCPRDFVAASGRSLLGAMVVSASGAARPPRGPGLDRLASRLRSSEPVVATLAGARIEADAGEVRVLRDPGDMRRRGSPDMDLPAGRPLAWDGRFELTTDRPGLRVRPLGGLAARLSKAEARALKAVHAVARRTLPAVVDDAGAVTCPILARDGPAAAQPLAMARLRDWSGAVADEAAIWLVAKADRTS